MPFALTEFPNYYFNLSVCASSRVTMWTGLYAFRHGVTGNSQGKDWADAGGFTHAVAKWAQTAGVKTAGYGKLLNLVVTDTYVAPGYDDSRWMVDDSAAGAGHENHVMKYVNPFLSTNGTLTPLNAGDTWTDAAMVGATTAASDARAAATASGYQTDNLNRRTLNYLDTATEPFYLELNTWAPHGDASAGNKPIPAARHAAAAFTATHRASWNEADIADKPKWVRDQVAAQMTAAQQTWADEYDVESCRTLQAVDELLYDVVRKLTAKGWIDRTVIIVVADNGAMVGEHRLTLQTAGSVKNVPYQPSIHSRAFVHFPTFSGRHNVVILKLDDTARHHFGAMTYLTSQVTATNTALVGNVDIAPTICDVLDAVPTRRPDGMSWVPLLDGRISAANFREQLLFEYTALANSSVAELPPFKGVVTRSGEKAILYDPHGGDPAEEEYYSAAAVAADEMDAVLVAPAHLKAAVAAMVAG